MCNIRFVNYGTFPLQLQSAVNMIEHKYQKKHF